MNLRAPLKYQTRYVAAFPDQKGFLREGLVFITLTSLGKQKFHFQVPQGWIRDIFCQLLELSSRSDGAFNFWDKDSKRKLTVCYDWSRGAENYNPATAKTYIYLHLPQEFEVKSKPWGGGRRK